MSHMAPCSFALHALIAIRGSCMSFEFKALLAGTMSRVEKAAGIAILNALQLHDNDYESLRQEFLSGNMVMIENLLRRRVAERLEGHSGEP